MNSIKQLIIDNYDIEGVKKITKLSGGMGGNSYYILSDKGEFVFKDVEPNSMNHPENEFDILNCLYEDDIPVATIYKTVDNEELLCINGRTYHLQTYITGRMYKPNTAPEWLLIESAVMLGRVQRSLKKLQPLPVGLGKAFFKYMTPDRAIENHENTLKIACDSGDDEIAQIIEEKILLIKRYSGLKFDIDKLTCCNTHGDYSINQIVCGEEKINGVIDFTSACIHPICWEVMRSYLAAHPSCDEGKPDRDNLNRYIENFLVYGAMNDYDIETMPKFYLYQNLVSDYFSSYYNELSHKQQRYEYAIISFKQCVEISNQLEDIHKPLEITINM